MFEKRKNVGSYRSSISEMLKKWNVVAFRSCKDIEFNPTINELQTSFHRYRIFVRDFFIFSSFELRELFSFDPTCAEFYVIDWKIFNLILKSVFGVSSSRAFDKLSGEERKVQFEDMGVDSNGKVRDLTFFTFERLQRVTLRDISENEFVRNIKKLHGLQQRTPRNEALLHHRQQHEKEFTKWREERKKKMFQIYVRLLLSIVRDQKTSRQTARTRVQADQVELSREGNPEPPIIVPKPPSPNQSNLPMFLEKPKSTVDHRRVRPLRNRNRTSTSSINTMIPNDSNSIPRGRPKVFSKRIRYVPNNRKIRKKKKKPPKHLIENARKGRLKRKLIASTKPKVKKYVGLDGKYWKIKPQVNLQVIECNYHYNELLSHLCCNMCHGVVRFRGNYVENGSQGKEVFGCHTPKCPQFSFSVLSCTTISIPGGKKKVPLTDALQAATSLLDGIGNHEARKSIGLSGLNPANPDSFGRLRKLVGEALLRYCEKNENKYLSKERELTVKLCGDEYGLYIIADGTYGTRGSGVSYRSNTAAVPAVGNLTGKVVSHKVASKKCLMCERAEKQGRKPKAHKCYRNYNPKESSKAMESKLMIENIDDLNRRMKGNMRVKHIGGDQDTTFMSKIRNERPDLAVDLVKHAGINHFLKNLLEWLENLKSSRYFGPDNRHVLTKKDRFKIVNVYMKRIMKQHKGDPDGMLDAVKIMIKHCFGERFKHKECGDWCDKSVEGAHHIKYSGERLYNDLVNCIVKRMEKNIQTLAHWAWDNWGEAVQNSIHSKHSKRTSSGGSGSFAYEVAVGVMNYNEGSKFVQDFLETELKIPPENINTNFLEKTIQKEEYDKAFKKTRKAKSSRAKKKFETIKSLNGVLKKTKDTVHVGNYGHASGYDGTNIDEFVDKKHEPRSERFEITDHRIDFQKEKKDAEEVREKFNLNVEEIETLQRTFLVDFETTSNRKNSAVPVEYSFKSLSGKRIYDTVIDPFDHINIRRKREKTTFQQAQTVHKISNESMKESPKVLTVMEDLEDDFTELSSSLGCGNEDFLFSAWNFDFDKTVLNKYLSQAKPDSKLLDCKWIEARSLVPNLAKNTTDRTLTSSFKKSQECDEIPPQAHKSFFDVEMMDVIVKNETPDMKTLAQNIINIKKRMVKRKNKKNMSLKFCSCKGNCKNCSCSKSGLFCLDNCGCNNEKCINRTRSLNDNNLRKTRLRRKKKSDGNNNTPVVSVGKKKPRRSKRVKKIVLGNISGNRSNVLSSGGSPNNDTGPVHLTSATTSTTSESSESVETNVCVSESEEVVVERRNLLGKRERVVDVDVNVSEYEPPSKKRKWDGLENNHVHNDTPIPNIDDINETIFQ